MQAYIAATLTGEAHMRTRLILITLLTTSLLAACETAKGVGRDITRAAEAVDRAI